MRNFALPMEYVIVQAGGKGSRLETLTSNKPKALVPVGNLPMVFHLFKKYPKAKFIIIGDYKFDVLKRYLQTFAKDIDFEVIKAVGKGTCSGISSALERIPENKAFMLIWCDLILSSSEVIPSNIENNFIGISKDFRCRWSFKDGRFLESPSSEHGVAGMFLFKNKSQISEVPPEGEFVRWLSGKNLEFNELGMYGGIEVGTMLSYFQNELNKPKCRPFNKIEFSKDRVIKYALDEQGAKLARDEVGWYKEVTRSGFKYIPKVFDYSPLAMERVQGENVFYYSFLTKPFKKALLTEIVNALDSLHNLAPSSQASPEDCMLVYFKKTFDRLSSVKHLVPFASEPYIKINGKNCRNVFFIEDQIRESIKKYLPEKFYLIHGDCTFHNILIDTKKVRPVLIDPRGYFGSSKLYGDIDYDWAKLYYSICGDYDQFNRKNFSLLINEFDVELEIVSNNWSQLEDYFFSITKANKKKIRLLHALIWLSLTTYAWDDYDAICGAFYKGLLELNRYLSNE